MPNAQREEIAAFLAQQRTGVISTAGAPGVWAMPVWYRARPGNGASRSLEVDCLLPRWSDVAHHLAEEQRVILIVQAASRAGLRWLQIQGAACPLEAPDWARLLPRWASCVRPDSLYLVVRVTPSRIDLIDEEVGWGVQETWEG